MEQEKSPFEEIFKREEKQKEKQKEDEGILGVLDKEEKNIFKESGDASLQIEKTEEATLGEEGRYLNLVKELLKHHYYGEALSIIEEMKGKFAS